MMMIYLKISDRLGQLINYDTGPTQYLISFSIGLSQGHLGSSDFYHFNLTSILILLVVYLQVVQFSCNIMIKDGK